MVDNVFPAYFWPPPIKFLATTTEEAQHHK